VQKPQAAAADAGAVATPPEPGYNREPAHTRSGTDMGFRDFLKNKMDKHGGAGGLAKHAIRKPVRIFTGGRGMASSEPDPGLRPEVLREMLASVPAEPSADGFIAVAPTPLITPTRPGTFNVGQDIVAIYRYEGGLYAISAACTHEDGPLGESEVEEGGVITCPYHDWRFELSTGACLTDPSRPVSCFAVREEGGFVWIGSRTSEGSTERGGEHDDGLKMDEGGVPSSR